MQTYSYVHGTEPAELFFVPTTSYFNSFPTSDIDRKIYGNGARAFLMTGYENRDHVYAALLAVAEDLYSGFHGAEVRVFRKADDMEKAQQGSEVARYFCEDGSVIADQYEFRP